MTLLQLKKLISSRPPRHSHADVYMTREDRDELLAECCGGVLPKEVPHDLVVFGVWIKDTNTDDC